MSRKFKITEQFSVNGITGAPEINYMVEYKDFGKDWLGLRMFVTKEEAERTVAFLEAEEADKAARKDIKLDLFSRLKK